MKKPLYGDWNTTPRSECLQTGEKIDKETLFHFKENSKIHVPDLIQIDEVADIAGGTPLYDTIYREHEYAPWIYGGQCEAGKMGMPGHRKGRGNPDCSAFIFSTVPGG